jgi:hypothetical protein
MEKRPSNPGISNFKGGEGVNIKACGSSVEEWEASIGSGKAKDDDGEAR